jgi:hypothetical protein
VDDVGVDDFGTKLLGSYVGSDVYIRNCLNNHILMLKEEARKLTINMSDIQCRMVLMRNSFIRKIDYLFRTIPPYLSVGIVEEYTGLLKKLISDMLSNVSRVSISSIVWKQMCLKIPDGGLGLGNVDNLRYCAYLASFTQCSSVVFEHHRSINFEFEQGFSAIQYTAHVASYIEQPRDSIQYLRSGITTVQSVFECIHEVNNVNVDINNIFHNYQSQKGLQHILSDLMYERFLDSFTKKELIATHNPALIANVGSLQNLDSGRWLSVVPKFQQYTMSSSEF